MDHAHQGLLRLAAASLDQESEESIYAPGYIQAYGALLVLQEPGLRIVQASENVRQFFGVAATDLLGKSLRKLLTAAQVSQVADLLAQDPQALRYPFELKVYPRGEHSRLRQGVQVFKGILHRLPEVLVLELEPLASTTNSNLIQVYNRLQEVIRQLRRTHSLSRLAQALATGVKQLTGFDRVMVYQFAADGHGMVIAEAKEEDLESYLGLHYPATDITTAARLLLQRNWVRQIPEVSAAPVPLVPALNPLTKAPLDLGSCLVRGVSPCHVEYLQNMGVGSSLTISLVDDQSLWGLIACHHSQPRRVDYETRKTCELIGQFASIELVHQQERDLDTYRQQTKAIQVALQKALLVEPNFIELVLARSGEQLLNLVHSQGVAILLDGSPTLIGQTPSAEQVVRLSGWLGQTQKTALQADRVYATDCLGAAYPEAQSLTPVASGILVISVVLTNHEYYIIWFRPEQTQVVSWAGQLQNSITTNSQGVPHLCPRCSFALWEEIVQGKSLPWLRVELEVALEMQNILMLAALGFAQEALEEAVERANIANQAKTQILAKMSHELRTPINAILGFTQLISRHPQTPPAIQEDIEIINRSGEHLLELINDVLDMSRIESGQLVLRATTFSLPSLLQNVANSFALQATQKGLVITVEESAELPRFISTDEGKLRQILLNLIGNAVKFTSQGQITVRVWATALDQPSEYTPCTADVPCSPLLLSLAVEDTGCGIEASNWEAIFEPFMQTEQGYHRQGTGLGLPISRQFARLMGGDITVQSTLGQGSIFTCQVMVGQAPDLEPLKTPGPRVIGLAPDQPPYRILVAEDSPESRQLLSHLLSLVGFTVLAVENGAAAVAQWQVWLPQLILMDIHMPEMDGYEAVRQIRAWEQQTPKSTPTKIIALTAYAFDTDRAASLAAGYDDHLAKPFQEKRLLELIALHGGVRYQYEVPLGTAETKSESHPLTPQDLALMPQAWVAQVHEAALGLQDHQVRQLLTEIPATAAWLGDSLRQMLEEFQLEAIANLTQP